MRFSSGVINKIKFKTEQAAVNVVTNTNIEAGTTFETVMIREAHKKAMQDYTPRVYDGDLILFTAEDQGDEAIYPAHLGWQGYLKGNLKLVPIPGQHLTIFDQPHVATLARELDTFLHELS